MGRGLKMGSKSSVPVKESARQVIARSKLQAEQIVAANASAVSPPLHSATPAAAVAKVTAPAAPAQAVPSAPIIPAAPAVPASAHKMEDFMDPTILKEMSSWAGSLKSEVDTQALSLRTSVASKSMATFIRFNEEKELTDRFGKLRKEVSGKLTEEQLMTIYKRALSEQGQGQAASAAALASEFLVSERSIELLLAAARAPKLVAKTDGANKTNLNELVLAV